MRNSVKKPPDIEVYQKPSEQDKSKEQPQLHRLPKIKFQKNTLFG